MKIKPHRIKEHETQQKNRNPATKNLILYSLSLSLPSLTHHSPFHLHSLSRRSQRRHFIRRRWLTPRSHHSLWLIRVGRVRLRVPLTSQVRGWARPWLLALDLWTWLLLLLRLGPTQSSPRLGVRFTLLLESLEYGIGSEFGRRADGVAKEVETVGFDGIVLVELGLVVWNDFIGFEEAEMMSLDLLQTQKP